MRKYAVLFLAMVAVAFMGTAWAAETAPYTNSSIDNVVGVAISQGVGFVDVKDDGDYVIITITNPLLTPIGVDTHGKNLVPAETLKLYSGIMDAAGTKSPFVVAKVINGVATFKIPNTAKRAGVPVVEHLWGRSGNGKLALTHNLSDPWTCYKKTSDDPDMNTLATGLVMYPNKPTVPLMSIGQGKLNQGKHPELQ